MKVRQRYFWFDDPHSRPLARGREIIVDCFAGGGGASEGIEDALDDLAAKHFRKQLIDDLCVDVAINHDKSALAMHLANHPRAKHYCENLWEVDPRDVCEGRPVGLAWFSPDCTHHSKAKGSQPRRKELRAQAWIVLRWAARVRPRVIIVENVEEFVTWGPLRKGKLVASKKGKTFRKWLQQLQDLGYVVEWRNLVASDYGAPTSRKRLFLVARCDGAPIVWPTPTHGSPKTISRLSKPNGCCDLSPWRTAAEIIDWSDLGHSIFMTAEEAHQLRKETGVRVIRPLAEKSMKRVAEGVRRFVIETADPFIVRVNHGSEHFRGAGLDQPLGAVTSKNGFGLVTPFVAALQQGGSVREIDRPIHTITASTKDCNLLVAPQLMSYYGEREGQQGRGRTMDNPVPTVTTENRVALVSAFVAKHFGGVTGHGVGQPWPTVTSVPTQNQLVAACLVKNNHGQKQAFEAREPLLTVVSQGTHHALVACRVSQVRAFLFKYYGSGGQWNAANEPAPTITVKDRLALGIVLINDELFQIVDILMRMLTPRELFSAQGFPADYEIDTGLNGKPASKTIQVGRCGNSVSPPPAKAIVLANFKPRIIRPGRASTEVAAHA